jgi:hypothetical protein
MKVIISNIHFNRIDTADHNGRGPRHEMPSPAQTLGSWVRTPLGVRLSVRISPVFVLSGVGSGIATGLTIPPKSPTDCL